MGGADQQQRVVPPQQVATLALETTQMALSEADMTPCSGKRPGVVDRGVVLLAVPEGEADSMADAVSVGDAVLVPVSDAVLLPVPLAVADGLSDGVPVRVWLLVAVALSDTLPVASVGDGEPEPVGDGVPDRVADGGAKTPLVTAGATGTHAAA